MGEVIQLNLHDGGDTDPGENPNSEYLNIVGPGLRRVVESGELQRSIERHPSSRVNETIYINPPTEPLA